MEETEIIENLTLFGLSRQDAVIYLCLLKNGERTGYEVAKQTGISRSNVYSTLAGLVEHGAAYIIEGNSSKYMAVPMEEFCENKVRRMQEVKEFLIKNVPNKKETIDGYITIEGNRHVMDKIRNMLLNAKQRVYLSAPCSFIELWQEEMEVLIKKQIKLVFITEQSSSRLADKDITVHLTEERKDNQVRLIIDSSHVLAGEINGKHNDNCLYCEQKNFVNVFKEAMSNEIKLIELKGQIK